VLGITPASLFPSAFTITMNRIVTLPFQFRRPAANQRSFTRRTEFCGTDMSCEIISEVIAGGIAVISGTSRNTARPP
jgi:hypothetical protein